MRLIIFHYNITFINVTFQIRLTRFLEALSRSSKGPHRMRTVVNELCSLGHLVILGELFEELLRNSPKLYPTNEVSLIPLPIYPLPAILTLGH